MIEKHRANSSIKLNDHVLSSVGNHITLIFYISNNGSIDTDENHPFA